MKGGKVSRVVRGGYNRRMVGDRAWVYQVIEMCWGKCAEECIGKNSKGDSMASKLASEFSERKWLPFSHAGDLLFVGPA